MTDDTLLDLGDLDARAEDLDEAELDEITGGFGQHNRAVRPIRVRRRPTAARKGLVKSTRAVRVRGRGQQSKRRGFKSPRKNRPKR